MLMTYEARIENIQRVIALQLPSGILVALRLKNADALKLLLTVRPEEYTVADGVTGKTPAQIAKDMKFEDAILIFD